MHRNLNTFNFIYTIMLHLKLLFFLSLAALYRGHVLLYLELWVLVVPHRDHVGEYIFVGQLNPDLEALLVFCCLYTCHSGDSSPSFYSFLDVVTFSLVTFIFALVARGGHSFVFSPSQPDLMLRKLLWGFLRDLWQRGYLVLQISLGGPYFLRGGVLLLSLLLSLGGPCFLRGGVLLLSLLLSFGGPCFLRGGVLLLLCCFVWNSLRFLCARL